MKKMHIPAYLYTNVDVYTFKKVSINDIKQTKTKYWFMLPQPVAVCASTSNRNFQRHQEAKAEHSH